MNVAESVAQSHRFDQAIKQIAGPLFLNVAPLSEDLHHATDFTTVLHSGQVQLAARVRSYRYLGPYGDEFTIRCQTKTGAKTELDKIIEGWGTHIFYGFASPDTSADTIVAWFIGDLNVFRGWYSKQLAISPVDSPPGKRVPNQDGSAGRAFGIDDLPNEFVVARQRERVLAFA